MSKRYQKNTGIHIIEEIGTYDVVMNSTRLNCPIFKYEVIEFSSINTFIPYTGSVISIVGRDIHIDTSQTQKTKTFYIRATT
jgi:hypothetical protein